MLEGEAITAIHLASLGYIAERLGFLSDRGPFQEKVLSANYGVFGVL